MPKKFALIGSPVSHSLSPFIHQSWFTYYDIDATYSLIDCSESQLPTRLALLKKEYQGFNITMPLKEAVMGYLDLCLLSGQQAQAVNGVNIIDGKLIGFNSDIAGIALSLKQFDFTNTDKKVLVLGSGGSARACIVALINEGFKVSLTARNNVTVEKIKQQFPSITIKEWLVPHNEPFWINTTASELDEADYPSAITSALALDLRYKPPQPAFLRRSKATQQQNGLTMLLGQAASAFEQWHGFYPDIEVAKYHLDKKGLIN